MYNPTPYWKKLNVSDLRMNDHVLKQDHEQCTIKQPAPRCKTARCEKYSDSGIFSTKRNKN